MIQVNFIFHIVFFLGNIFINTFFLIFKFDVIFALFILNNSKYWFGIFIIQKSGFSKLCKPK